MADFGKLGRMLTGQEHIDPGSLFSDLKEEAEKTFYFNIPEKPQKTLTGIQPTGEQKDIAKGILDWFGTQYEKSQEALSSMNINVGGKQIDPMFTSPLAGVTKAPKILKGITVVAEKPTQIFGGFRDITTKILERLKGKATASKQEILDFTNMPELKQVERDLTRRVIGDFGDQIPVQEFANKVKTELLPLERKGTVINYSGRPSNISKYENISLPDELRGPIANYGEKIYLSPIKTSAGGLHFTGIESGKVQENYFAHTRIEDIPKLSERTVYDNNIKAFEGKTGNIEKFEPGTTRRVIEIQSDLFQKGRLEEELENIGGYKAYKMDSEQVRQAVNTMKERGFSQKKIDEQLKLMTSTNEKFAQREVEVAKLEPYRNTWHERIIREEVKQAAKDGKTKLQFPTGETAMKIEGLGEESRWSRRVNPNDPATAGRVLVDITEKDLKVGKEILQGGAENKWIITDVLGDGKFKAVPKITWDEYKSKGFKSNLENISETFDISGKVDTENPIYKFYEKEVRKFLQNKFGAKEITDPQGVKWIEVDISPQMAKDPVLAYGGAKLGTILGGAAAASTLVVAPFLGKGKEIKITGRESGRIGEQELKEAIGKAETSIIPEEKRYSYKKHSGSRLFGDDLGKYQVTSAELKTYSERYLGKQVKDEEFLNSPELQEKYMAEKIRFLKKEGLTDEEIIAVHRGGLNADFQSERSKRYVKSVLSHLK